MAVLVAIDDKVGSRPYGSLFHKKATDILWIAGPYAD
jgi:hypothetical protein